MRCHHLIYAAALASTVLCGQAQAQYDHIFHHTFSHVPSHWFLDRGPRVVSLPPMTEAQLAEDRKWQAFCQPVRTADDLGVVRLSYAHEGCEFGRTQ